MNVQRAVELQEQAWSLQAEGKLDDAWLRCREALQLMEASDGPDSPDVANLLNDLAEIETERQNFPAALALAERAQAIADGLGDGFRGEEAARIRLRTLEITGELRRMLGDYARAEVDLERALMAAVAEFGEASAEVAEARNNLGVLYKHWGRFEDGLRLYRQALRHCAGISAVPGIYLGGARFQSASGALPATPPKHGSDYGRGLTGTRRAVSGSGDRESRSAGGPAAIAADGTDWTAGERWHRNRPFARRPGADDRHDIVHREPAAFRLGGRGDGTASPRSCDGVRRSVFAHGLRIEPTVFRSNVAACVRSPVAVECLHSRPSRLAADLTAPGPRRFRICACAKTLRLRLAHHRLLAVVRLGAGLPAASWILSCCSGRFGAEGSQDSGEPAPPFVKLVGARLSRKKCRENRHIAMSRGRTDG